MTVNPVADLALLDTNVLVYAMDETSAFHAASRKVVLRACDSTAQERLCVAPQVLAEFFAVVTNPKRVQRPRTPAEALMVVEQFLALPNLSVLPVPIDVVSRWIILVRERALNASRVFDAQLVATALANGVRRVYTYDRAHFECFNGIEVVTPA